MANRYKMSFAASLEHVPEQPERTARRQGQGLDFDVYFQVWPNRASMLKTIQMQESGEDFSRAWKPCQK